MRKRMMLVVMFLSIVGGIVVHECIHMIYALEREEEILQVCFLGYNTKNQGIGWVLHTSKIPLDNSTVIMYNDVFIFDLKQEEILASAVGLIASILFMFLLAKYLDDEEKTIYETKYKYNASEKDGKYGDANAEQQKSYDMEHT